MLNTIIDFTKPAAILIALMITLLCVISKPERALCLVPQSGLL